MPDDVERLTCSLETLKARPQDFSWAIRVTELGRSCFATEDIGAGQVLAYDEPLLHWNGDEPIDSPRFHRLFEACHGKVHNDVVNYLCAYAGASPDVRARIDDFTSTLTPTEATYIAHMTAVWTRIADDIWTARDLPDDDDDDDDDDAFTSRDHIVAILTKSHLNAHHFRTGHVMLEVASKFNHACSPNCSYNRFTDPVSGKSSMRIFTIKDVRRGEQLFSTYIGGTDMLLSTRDRRKRLQATKAFLCRCTRCRAPEILRPLPCPACRSPGPCLRSDDDDDPRRGPWPWQCLSCGGRFWDAEVTARESQLARLVAGLDADLDAGRLAPAQIMHLLLRDALEDLGPGHYLAFRARALLEEWYAFQEVYASDAGAGTEHLPHRIANAWIYVDFLMRVVWEISPVVASNLALLRLKTLVDCCLSSSSSSSSSSSEQCDDHDEDDDDDDDDDDQVSERKGDAGSVEEAGEEGEEEGRLEGEAEKVGEGRRRGGRGRIPPGVPRESCIQILRRMDSFLRSFWGEEDADARRFRAVLDRATRCACCAGPTEARLVVCGSCASVHYCSRTCREESRASHEPACLLGRAVGAILDTESAI